MSEEGQEHVLQRIEVDTCLKSCSTIISVLLASLRSERAISHLNQLRQRCCITQGMYYLTMGQVKISGLNVLLLISIKGFDKGVALIA